VSLSVGARFGPYEILSMLGAGGMGEVYRARDTKLNRDVAVKVLLASVASDPDRLARFSREAQVLASLNHPNIAHIHGVEDFNGVTALILELVEGEDLAQHLARGAVGVDDALPIATQIADALEAAHDLGIIHRDLKPANIKLRPDGTVKVLDFGLAKAVDASGSSSPAAMNSPTLSVHATQAGVILGTAAYMSPEQAAGKSVDQRTDLWAFGVVLMEMLTGRPVFQGETVSHVLAAVLKDEPDWTALPVDTTAPIRRLLRRCLEKDRRCRLANASDARLEITDGQLAEHRDRPVVAVSFPARRLAIPWLLAGVLTIGLGLVLWAPWRTAAPSESLHLTADVGGDVLPTFGLGNSISLSPDGTVIAFVAQQVDGGRPQIYLRRLTELRANALSGTDDAATPFFSPDGGWIGFFAGGKMKKIAVTGGATVPLCDAPNSRGGWWGEDGTIVFMPTLNGILMRVSSDGGTPQAVSSLVDREVTHRWPQVLPGGNAVLYTANSASGGYDDADLVVQSLSSGARTVVDRGGYFGRYVSSGSVSAERSDRSSGHLIYIHSGTLFAAPFDLERLTVTGPPVPALEGVRTNELSGGAQFTVSASGTIAYLTGPSTTGTAAIHWMDQKAVTTLLRATPANWLNLTFAPDGQRLALQITEGAQNDIGVYEWAADTFTRLTFDPSNDQKPVWSPDGSRVAFASARADKLTLNLYWQRADGTGVAHRLTESTQRQQPNSWHSSGKFLAFEQENTQTGGDVMILPLVDDDGTGRMPGQPFVFLNGASAEADPAFSPDGRWLAYTSDESGRREVYVRPFPGPGGQWQISNGGGGSPTWSRAKSELLYSSNQQQILVAPYTAQGDSFRIGKSRLWSEGRYVTRGPNRVFDLHPDGLRIALVPLVDTAGVNQNKVTLLFNFFDYVRRLAPVAAR
jgi:Tol biopolymer transport system component